jgi:type II secretory pathway component PulF
MNLSTLFIPTIKTRDKVTFYENISNLIDGGVPLVDALRGYVERTENVRMKEEI